MKKVKKILKWSAVVLALLIVVAITTIFMRQNLKFDAPYPEIHASKDSSVVARGKHIVFSQAHCFDCHYKGNADSLLALGLEPPLSGGRLFDIGIAKIYTPNITNDSTFGIGKKTDPELARAIRYGVHPDGTAMLGFMGFQNMTDDDLTAVISYLRTQKPVHEKIPEHKYGFVGMAIKAFLVKPIGPSGPVLKTLVADSTVEYGKYLVTSTTHCSSCHTKRDIAGNPAGPWMAGGNNVEGLISVNLTPDSTSRIFGWTQQMFIDRIRSGKLNPKSQMPWNSFKQMSDIELKAIYKYLRSVPAAKMPLSKS